MKPLISAKRRRVRLIVLSISLFFDAVSMTTRAQTTASPPSDSDAALQTIIVTAQRRSEDIQDVPISIQAFTGKELQERGIKSSVDIDQLTPNVDIALPSGVGNQPIITIRGIGLNDYDTNNAGPNGVYADDVYLSNPSSQSFQTFDLERVEVLKGPQGTLYGRNTSGGAINFISAQPTSSFVANFHADYSSYNTVNLEGAVSGPLSNDWEGRFAFVENHSEGYLYNSYLDEYNSTQNYALRAMLRFKPSDSFSILFSVHGGQVNNPFAGYQHLGDFVPGTQFNAVPTQCSVQQTYANKCTDLFGYGHVGGFYDQASEQQDRTKMNSLGGSTRVEAKLGDLNLTSISAFEHLDKVDNEDGDSTPYRMLEATYGVQSNAFTQEFRLSKTSDRYNWVAGVYYLYENLHQDQPLALLLDGDEFFGAGAFDGVAVTQFDTSRQVTKSYAAFGQSEFHLTDDLKMTLGGRFTSEKKNFQYEGAAQYQEGGIDNFGPVIPLASVDNNLSDSAFSWRAGLDYTITNGVMAYASVATGFKSGLFNGTFLSTNPAEIERQLTPVQPEKVTAYEVGIKSSLFSDRLIANAAVFYNDYRDMQVFVSVPPIPGGGGAPLQVLDNAQRAHTQGAELSLLGKPWSPLTLSAQVGFLQTELDKFVADVDPSQPNYSGNQLPLSPRWSVVLAGDYKIPFGTNALDFQANASYKDHQFFDVSNDPYITQDAYWIANARIAYQFVSDNFEIAAYMRNIGNRQYYVDKFDLTVPFGFIQGIVGAPRTTGIEFNARF
jgi:iron complex outermembrane recepter protein